MLNELNCKEIVNVFGGVYICADQPCGIWSSNTETSAYIPGGNHKECTYNLALWKHCGFENNLVTVFCNTTQSKIRLVENNVVYCENPGAAVITSTGYAEGRYCYLI